MKEANDKVEKLTDSDLLEVSGGLETVLPLNTALVTDDLIENSELKKEEKEKDHEIE